MFGGIPRAAIIPAFIAWTLGAAQTGDTLRLLTFNAAWLSESPGQSTLDPWTTWPELEAHRRQVAGVLAVARADVVVLQEVLSRGALQPLVQMLQKRGLSYHVYHLESDDTATDQDLALLLRFPADTIDGLASRKFFGPRGSPWRVTYRMPEGRRATTSLSKNLLVFATWREWKLGLLGLHLIANPSHPARNAKRAAQARVAASIIRSEIIPRGYLPVVLGDFNEGERLAGGNTDWQALSILKDWDPSANGEELFNAAEWIISPQRRYSSYWDRNKSRSRDPGEPLSMHDHILLPRALAQAVHRVWVYHEAHTGDVSDHWPVAVDLMVPSRDDRGK